MEAPHIISKFLSGFESKILTGEILTGEKTLLKQA
jgi:hypothetical protein